MDYNTILDYWFPDDKFQKFWFQGKKKKIIDDDIKDRFMDYVVLFDNNKLKEWKTKSFESQLALIILLDQFTRNIFRDQERDIKYDQTAYNMSKYVLKHYDYKDIKLVHLIFILMPFRHSIKLEDRQFVVDFNEQYEKNYKITDEVLWNKFKKASLYKLKN